MNIVVDTNILFSIIITPKGKIAATFEYAKRNNIIYISDFTFEEILKHRKKLIALSAISEAEIDKIIYFFQKDFSVVSSESFSNETIIHAFEYVKDVDIDDFPIVAAAMSTKSILFTGDKKLYTELKRKNFDSVCNTEELRELLNI